MNIKKWSPWNWFGHEDKGGAESRSAYPSAGNFPMMRLHHEIDRLFDQAIQGFNFPSVSEFPFGREFQGLLKPNLDISENGENYSISVELPGVEKEDVKVSLDGNRLIIKGEKKRESEEKKEDYHCVERSYGSFQRILNIPENANASQMNAVFKNGVLKVMLPKTSEAINQAREIKVEGG